MQGDSPLLQASRSLHSTGLAHRNLPPQHFLVKEVEEGVPAQLKLTGLGQTSSLTPGKLPQPHLPLPSQRGLSLPAGGGCIHCPPAGLQPRHGAAGGCIHCAGISRDTRGTSLPAGPAGSAAEWGILQALSPELILQLHSQQEGGSDGAEGESRRGQAAISPAQQDVWQLGANLVCMATGALR